MNDSKVQISKFLSFVLRHRPEEIGLHLDEHGWASVPELIRCAKESGIYLDETRLREIVESDAKCRYALTDDGQRVRANQGHSVRIDLGLEPVRPPVLLFHGTATRFVQEILAKGLQPMGRLHVHLSADEETAVKVGKRHGKPTVLRIKAEEMWKAGGKFYQAENGVWLTEAVEARFIEA